MSVKRWLWLATAALVLGSGTAAASCNTHVGELFVATGTSNPPPGAPGLLHGVATWLVPTGTSYTFSTALAPVPVHDGPPTCVTVPDFNVAWFQVGAPFDDLVGHQQNCGNPGGPITGNPDYGVVYMRFGPDPSTADGSFGAAFQISICG